MNKLRKYLSNIIGWSSNRKIIVFESDDWGGIRIADKDAYNRMLISGLKLDSFNFTSFDSLETNKDLEVLFDSLSTYKDSNNLSPVFTPMSIMANPDFDRIENDNFNNYYFEPFTETCRKSLNSRRVPELWKDGIENRLFKPQMHGREHINISNWLRLLQENNIGVKIAFENKSIGVNWFNKQQIPDHLSAFNPTYKDEILHYKQIVYDAADLFISVCGYTARHFIAPNLPEPKELEIHLNNIGIDFLTRSKFHKYPLGNNEYEYELNWLGKRNKLGQTFLTRNCSFEPSEFNSGSLAVENCLKEIETAFSFKKPAIISTHRVNYVSSISQKNADNGILKLKTLIKAILKKWPDVEFLTSEELGDYINSKKNG